MFLSFLLIIILYIRNGSYEVAYQVYPKIMTDNEETQKLLKQLIAKTEALDNKLTIRSDNLEQKINSLNNSIRTDINVIKRDLDELKNQNNEEIKNMNNKINDIEESQNLISTSHDEQKEKIAKLIEDNKKIHKENTLLHNTVKSLKEDLNQEKMQANQLGQYIRSSKMVEISGIPRRKKENCLDLISQLAARANITDFDVSQIDLAHRTSPNDLAPIIILFITKRDRLNFYSQKKKLFQINSSIFKLVHDDDNADVDDSLNDDAEGTPIYMNESLTPGNRRLLKEARIASRAKNYKHIGYTINGVVCVRKTDESDIIMIKNLEDLGSII